MAKKGLTLDEKREMIKALFRNKDAPIIEEEVIQKAPRRTELDEDEVLEKELVRRKARDKKKREGRKQPRGK